MFYALLPLLAFSQVKIGDNPGIIDTSSILELESNSKVFVLTRLTTAEISTVTPLRGALVYNIDEQCVFAYDGTTWKNLCNEPNISVSTTAPIDNTIGDFWLNPSTNISSIWNGAEWLPININPRRGNGPPDTSITNPVAGDIYVDEITGNLYTYNGTDWIFQSDMLTANNGLSINVDTIQLGGSLIQPTVITTDSTNTIAFQGLVDTVLDDSNSVVVVDNATGELKKTSVTNLVGQEQFIVMAAEGQLQFTTPLPITNINKIDVYRNGARISFTQIDANTIEVEAEAVCFAGDEIRIVQLR